MQKVLYNIPVTYGKVGYRNNRFAGKEQFMKKNIRVVLIGQLLLIIAVFIFNVVSGFGVSSMIWFIDMPSILLILIVLIPGLLIMGEWKDFIKAFSVGIKEYRLLELRTLLKR